jgi:glycosyltransferase involved in cell wall biosynthesis
MNADQDKEFLAASGAELVFFEWKGGDNRFSGIKFTSPQSLFSVISLIFRGRKKFKELIEQDKYDLILNCWVVPAGFWSYGLAEDVKSAVWALGSDISVYGRKFIFRHILKMIITKADHLLTNSLHNKAEMKRIFGRDPYVLFTGRNLPEPRTRYLQEDVLKLVFVGRLEKIKGPDLLISALMLSGIENFTLKIIGDGTMRNELALTVGNNGLTDKIFFTGQKNSREISDCLSESDYLVISSRSESMPVVFWEAMQSSTPVISTDVGDIKHYCDEFNVGRICEPNERSLADLIGFIYNFRPLRNTLSENTSKAADVSNIAHSAKILCDLC